MRGAKNSRLTRIRQGQHVGTPDFLAPFTFTLLVVFLDHAGDVDLTGSYPSVRTLARRVGRSPRHVYRGIATLRSIGWLVRTGTTPSGVGIYRIGLGPGSVDDPRTQTDAIDAETAAQSHQRGDMDVTPPPDMGVSQNDPVSTDPEELPLPPTAAAAAPRKATRNQQRAKTGPTPRRPRSHRGRRDAQALDDLPALHAWLVSHWGRLDPGIYAAVCDMWRRRCPWMSIAAFVEARTGRPHAGVIPEPPPPCPNRCEAGSVYAARHRGTGALRALTREDDRTLPVESRYVLPCPHCRPDRHDAAVANLPAPARPAADEDPEQIARIVAASLGLVT